MFEFEFEFDLFTWTPIKMVVRFEQQAEKCLIIHSSYQTPTVGGLAPYHGGLLAIASSG